MQNFEDTEIRQQTADLMIAWAARHDPPFTGETPDGFPAAIAAAHAIADEARIGLQAWVEAARRTGVSWSDIGAALGISKQAAQQRFKLVVDEEASSTTSDDEIVRSGADAFNEMRILSQEGEAGRELIRTSMLTLVFRQTAQKWDYRRRIGLLPLMIAETEKAGWSHVDSWLPFHYFKRMRPSDF